MDGAVSYDILRLVFDNSNAEGMRPVPPELGLNG